MASDGINPAYVRKPLWKLKRMRLEELLGQWKGDTHARESGVLGKSMEALPPFAIPCSRHLSRLAVPELNSFIIN